MPDNWDFSQARRQQADPLASVPILTYLLTALSVMITAAALYGSGAGPLIARLGTFGYADAEDIWNGHVWGLVTTVFIHGGLWHLVFDMLWLVQLGRILERTLPPAVYLGFILASAAVGSATEMLVSGQTGIGMSGVVYAMFGLMWAGRGAFPLWRTIATSGNLWYLVGWGVFCVFATYFHLFGLNIANGAHAGGFLFGLCLGYLFYSPRRRWIWAAPLALLLTACVLACTYQPWSANWTFWKGNKAFDRKQYARAIDWYQASLRRGGDPHAAWGNIGLAWNNIAAEDQGRKDLTGEAKALAERDSAAQRRGRESRSAQDFDPGAVTNTMSKKRLLSGMQPTGGGFLHIGNLEGALRAWVQRQNEYEMFCMIADWHSLTTIAEKRFDIAEASKQTALDYLAAGLDPDQCAIFRQSDVPQHAELHLLLSMVTPVGWLERVPTYKDKRDLVKENDTQVSYGLLGYPVLQTADIIVYRAQAVPVGRDQAAHIEISREIARRFNHLVGADVFPEPDAVINEFTGELPGMDGRKMSKSYDNAIYLSDTPKQTQKKINSAFTTPTKIHLTDPGIPEGCVACKLRRVYDPANYRTQWDECRAGERGCGQSKKELAEIINENLAPIRARRAELAADPAYVDAVLKQGAETARAAASETLTIVRKALLLA